MEILNSLHGILRWAVLLFALICIVKSFQGMMAKTVYTKTDNLMSVIFVSVCDVQLILGIILYVFGAWGIKNIQNQGMAVVMKDSYSRFFAIEHIAMMLIALVIIHIGRAKSKKAFTDLAKHKKVFWFYLIGLMIMLASIPWPFKKGFEALGWF
jgi:hypothetical protein